MPVRQNSAGSDSGINELHHIFTCTILHFGAESARMITLPEFDLDRLWLVVKLKGMPVGIRYGAPADLRLSLADTTYGKAIVIVETACDNPHREPEWEFCAGTYDNKQDIRLSHGPQDYSLHSPTTTVASYFLSLIDERLFDALANQQKAKEFQEMIDSLPDQERQSLPPDELLKWLNSPSELN